MPLAYGPCVKHYLTLAPILLSELEEDGGE